QPPQTIQQKTRPSGRRQHIPSFSLTILLSKTVTGGAVPSGEGAFTGIGGGCQRIRNTPKNPSFSAGNRRFCSGRPHGARKKDDIFSALA
ncbi:hypothetical protein, partial [Gluconacetobacter diazotrophicus]